MAVHANTGFSGAPLSAWRGPNVAASSSRRPASPGEIRHRIAKTSRHDLAPIAFAVVSACKRVSMR
jgi:hypothetical protein